MSSRREGGSASAFKVSLSNLGVDLETVGGVTYPHHVFGHNMVLRPVGRPEILLPGAYGEVYVEPGKEYSVQSVSMP
ncbi:hypothetical protein DQ04_00761160 [Trypanosoma grayi]|uniref:hypothetical protein n=1 Tax=Trypanosoma grayi TaxID=71804 RepID=UPI0004F45035|nr:hypothetical protein DQ04_00761160 [Trypanosoma grayi]KEG13836.1 hypothetical protein DQ04_00761160 [Trypanosoma grayi]